MVEQWRMAREWPAAQEQYDMMFKFWSNSAAIFSYFCPKGKTSTEDTLLLLDVHLPVLINLKLTTVYPMTSW